MNDDTPRSSLPHASSSQSSYKSSFETSKTSHLIETLVREPKWNKVSLNCSALFHECLVATLGHLPKTKAPFELSILLTNDTEIQSLNKEYRQKNTPTNVLAFESGYPLETQKTHKQSHPIPLGDLVLSYETLEKEAHIQGKSFQTHLTHLLIHGLLHLLGFDHEEDEEAEKMERLEITILETHFHIKNPYIEKG